MTSTIFANARLEGFLVTHVGSAEAEEALAIVRELVEAEREACAKVADDYAKIAGDSDEPNAFLREDMAELIATDIRARGKP